MADAEDRREARGVAPQIPGIITPPALDMSWAKVPTERPPKPVIGDEGFTLRLADAGAYAWAPDHWPYENDTPRGSWPVEGHGAAGAVHDLRQDRSAGPRTPPTSTSWRSASSGSRRPRSPGAAIEPLRGSHRGIDRPDRLEHLRAAVQLERRC